MEVDNNQSTWDSKTPFIQQYHLKCDLNFNNHHLTTILARTSIIERVLRKFLFPKSTYNSISLYSPLYSITQSEQSISYFQSILTLISNLFSKDDPLFIYAELTKEFYKLLKEPDLSSLNFDKFILKMEFFLAWHFENNFYEKQIDISSQQQNPLQPKTNFNYSIESINTLCKFLKVFEKQGLSTKMVDFFYSNHDLFCIEKIYYFYCDNMNKEKKLSGNVIEYLLKQLNKKINSPKNAKVLDIHIENYILLNLYMIHKILCEYSFYLSKNPELESIFNSIKELKLWPIPVGTFCNEVIECLINEIHFQGTTILNKLRDIFFIDFLGPNTISINTKYFNSTMLIYSNDPSTNYGYALSHNSSTIFNLASFIQRLITKRVKKREKRLSLKELIVRLFITILFNSKEVFDNTHLKRIYDMFYPEIWKDYAQEEEYLVNKKKVSEEEGDVDHKGISNGNETIMESMDMLLKVIDTGFDMKMEMFDENVNTMAKKIISKCNKHKSECGEYDNILYNEYLLPITSLRCYIKPKYNAVNTISLDINSSTFSKDLFSFYQKHFKYVVNNYFSHLLRTSDDPIIEEKIQKERNAIYNKYKINLVLIEEKTTFSQFIKNLLKDIQSSEEITNEDFDSFWKYFVFTKSEIQPKYLLHVVPFYKDSTQHYFNNIKPKHPINCFYLSEYIASNDPIYKNLIFMPWASTGDKDISSYISTSKFETDDIMYNPNIDTMYSFLKKPLDYYICDSTGVMNMNIYQVKVYPENNPNMVDIEPFWKNLSIIINENSNTKISMKCVDYMGLDKKEEKVNLKITNPLKIQVFNLFYKKDFPFNYNMPSNNGYLEVFICDGYSKEKEKMNRDFESRNKGKFYDELNIPQMDLDTLYKNYKVKSITIKTDKKDPICLINNEELIKFWEMDGNVVINISHYEKDGKEIVIPVATFISI